jgi:tungstate transport system substrate-binding protein
MNCRRWLIPILALLVTSATALAVERSIILQSTTSTANSGLYDHLLPIFTEKSGITVHVVAVGTGQAIKNAQNGDGDVLLVHARSAEEAFVAEGYGVERFDVQRLHCRRSADRPGEGQRHEGRGSRAEDDR